MAGKHVMQIYTSQKPKKALGKIEMALFQRALPKFNRYSFDVFQNSQGKLLPSQNEALRELQEHFEEKSGCIGLVSMPTGSGKTGVISCLPYFLGMLGMSPPPEPGASPYGKPLHKFDKPVLVIAPDLAIANQLEETLTVSADAPGENFLLKRNIIPPHAVDYALPVGQKIEDTKHVCNAEFLRSKDVIISNAQKFLKDEWEEVLPEDIFKLVIVDEAHHHPSKTWRRIIQKFRNHAMVVFFTATPYRGDMRIVLPKEEGEIVYHLPLQTARQLRIIRLINWLDIATDCRTEREIPRLILGEVQCIQKMKDRENPLPDGIPHMAIAITKNIAYAEEVADFWNNQLGNSGSAIAYHSDVPPKKRKTMMEAIKANRVKLVVVVESLLEGFDHPPISIAAIMTRIVSPVKFAQFIGRAQRIVRVRGVPEAIGILADVVTHTIFQQRGNYIAFEQERLIPVD